MDQVDSDFPQYSLEGMYSVDMFLADDAEVFFYFEDAKHEPVYERLVERVFDNVRKFVVICLGGKSQLIKKSQEESAVKGVRVFIADRDFDEILNNVFVSSGFYYFDRSCLESYFFDEKAIAKICIEEVAGTSKALTYGAACVSIGDFNDYKFRLLGRYREITRYFVLAQKYNIGIKNTKMDVDELLEGADQESPIPTEEWLGRYRERFKNACVVEGQDWLAIDEALDSALASVFLPLGEDQDLSVIDTHMNGKHLFMILMKYVQSRVGVEISKLPVQQLYLRIMNLCDISQFDGVKSRVASGSPEIFR